MSSFDKDSAQLEREVEEQRQRIESRIGEIRERLSPGQLVDEVLSYTKNGGQQFAANLGSTIAHNPLPSALLGLSLFWFMTGQSPKLTMPRLGSGKHSHKQSSSDYTGYNAEQADYGYGESPSYGSGSHSYASGSQSYGSDEASSGSYAEEDDYSYATVSGGLTRVSHSEDTTGDWYSEFADTSGKRYKAKSNKLGHRMGHFFDDSGKKIGGFIDDTGRRVKDFRDEAGNMLGDAAGWASHAWSGMRHGVGQALGQVAGYGRQLGGGVSYGADRAGRMMVDGFQSQPLIGAALAFAAGAAIGAGLPRTEQEDQALGRVADKVKTKAAEVAAEAYEEGKHRAAELYEKGKEGAARLYEDVLQQTGASTTNRSELH